VFWYFTDNRWTSKHSCEKSHTFVLGIC